MTENPGTQWLADPRNIDHRIERVILLAREHLHGYDDKDIQSIWETIKHSLPSQQDCNCPPQIDDHPPIDRLFEIAFDFNGATESMIEGEIKPAAICAAYALKTVEYAKTTKDPLSSCLICIDAWRALAFIPRAEYLEKKLTQRIRKKMGGEKSHPSIKDVTKGRQEYEQKLSIIKPEFDKLSDDIKYKKELEGTADLILNELSNINDSFDAVIEEHTVMSAIRDFRREKKIQDLQKYGVKVPLNWPKRQPDDRDRKIENFSGEVREFDKRNKANLKEWAKNRVDLERLHEGIHKTWSEF